MSSLITAVLTLSGVIGYQQVNPPRPDPFTSVQGTELRKEMERKISESEQRLAQRMHKIETTDELIQETQREMWTIIQTLPPERWRRRVEELEIFIIRKLDDSYEVPE